MTGREQQGRKDRQYGAVRGLAPGAYAEGSPDVHHLASALADCIAHRVWRRWGARSEAEARSFVVARVRRIIGSTVARAMARHFLRRLPFVGLTRAAMDRRRQAVRARGPCARGAAARKCCNARIVGGLQLEHEQ